MISELSRPATPLTPLTPLTPSTSRSIVTPRFLLRVGGLAQDTVDHLRFSHTIEWQEGLLALEQHLLEQKAALVDMLHEQVNLHKEEQALRRKLINLKRQVFNLHFPHGTQDARATGTMLASAEQTMLNTWLDLWDRYQQEQGLGAAIVEQELGEKRALLKKVVQDDDFRKGVLLSSPVLYQAMEHYLHADNTRPNREARTVERSLLEYLLRTMHKTSPFSTFTPVCIGQFTDNSETEQDIDLAISSMQKQSFTRLNMLVLSRLSAQMLASPEVRKHLRVCITPGWRRQNESIRYIRRKPMLDNPDSDAALPLDFIQEHVIKLPAGPLLNMLIDLMQDGHEEMLSSLIARLQSRDSHHRAEAMIEEYLHHLLRLGFLIVPALQVDIHAPRPLDSYVQRLHSIGAVQTDLLAQKLDTIAALIDAYATAPLTQRATLVEQVKQLLQEGSVALGYTPQSLVLPRTLVYEDTTVAPEKLAVNTEQLADIFSDLGELQRILPVFDSRVALRVLTRGYFQARYGQGERCDDFLAFAERFNTEFLRSAQRDTREMRLFDQDGTFQGRQDYFGQKEIAAINEARRYAITHMQQAYQQQVDSDEVVLEDDFVQKLIRLAPQQGHADLQSNTFFSQFAHIGGNPSLVVNQIYPGLTLMFSRFAYCFANQPESVVSALRQTLVRLQTLDADPLQGQSDTHSSTKGMIFAELKGGYDATNLNLHPAVTAYELVCPGEISSRPPEEQIPMEDLYIQDDVRTGRLALYSKRLQQEVVPLYLGFLAPMLLPEIQQVLLNFSYLSTATLDLWNGVQMVDSRESTPALDGGPTPQEHTTFYPRLRYKHLILQRATWKMAASSLPARESGQSDADFYLHVTRWRKAHGLPNQVFVAPSASSQQREEDDEQAEKVYQSYKPLFVDFENLFSVLLLEATLRKAQSDFLLTEVLPAREQLWFKHEQRPYINEFVFEVSHTRKTGAEDHA